MMRDYKLETLNRRPRHRGKLRWVAALTVLVTTLGVVRFFDLGEFSASMSAQAGPAAPVSLALTLPPVDGLTETPISSSKISRPEETLASASHAETIAAAVAITPQALKDPVADASGAGVPSLLKPADANPDVSTETQTAVAEPILVERAQAIEPRWVEHKIAAGESLARIFDQQGLDAGLLHRIVQSSAEAKNLADLRPGQRLRFQFDENNELTRLELHRNRVESIRVAITDETITTDTVSKDVERRVAATAGLIESSLFVDGQRAGLSDGQIMELATIFGWDIDFALEIRAGDQFRVLYEELYLDGEKLRDGSILAAEFTNRGTTYRAVRYEDGSGEVGYYDADGQSKRRAFIRTPIKFARVSSRFNPKRWHPVLKKWRSHKGVDYAAPTGTPVKATGDGRVVFRGAKNGYGKTVILEHAGKYTTLYAHLSGYSKRAQTGKRVKQGQVIGYVGKTGLATGPHLHYEFRVHGEHRDPLRVKLPKSLSLPETEIARFRKETAPLLAKLEGVSAETMVASAASPPSNP